MERPWRRAGRKRPVEISADELEQVTSGGPREIDALRHNIRQLYRESRKAREAVAWLENERATLLAQLAERPAWIDFSP